MESTIIRRAEFRSTEQLSQLQFRSLCDLALINLSITVFFRTTLLNREANF